LIEIGSPIILFDKNAIIMARLFSKENLLFIGFDDYTLLLFDLSENQVVWRFKGDEYPGFNDKINTVLLSNDGNTCVTIKNKLIKEYHFSQ